MIWYALFIPIVLVYIAWFLYKNEITWWEILLPTGFSFIFILISYFTLKLNTLHDVEYNGYLVTHAVYYEPYETYVQKTCSRTTCVGSGKTRTCVTTYYDCSYCDETPARYVMVDNSNNEISITKGEFLFLKKEWKANSIFWELNRNINYSGSCGEDGDAYIVYWDKKIETVHTTTYVKSFSNILKCNHSAFNYPEVSKELAIKNKLYEYPDIKKHNNQNTVLGIEKLNIRNKRKFIKTMNYINGAYGRKYRVRLYTLFFIDSDISKAFLQEAYWDGGNQNEIVVCVGTDINGNINWIKPFSWSDNKRVVVDIREDLMNSKVINDESFKKTYINTIKNFWKFKSFDDFNYLSFEPTKGQLIFVYLTTLIITIITILYAINNQENNK